MTVKVVVCAFVVFVADTFNLNNISHVDFRLGHEGFTCQDVSAGFRFRAARRRWRLPAQQKP